MMARAVRELDTLDRIDNKLTGVRQVDDSLERTFDRVFESYCAVARVLREAGIQPSNDYRYGPEQIEKVLRDKLGLPQP